jgi:hypothetical protein
MQAHLDKRSTYRLFLGDFGKFTDAVTVLLKLQHPEHHTYWRDEMAEPTAKWFIDRLNKKVFGRAYLGSHQRLPVVISYERGGLANRPHFHLVTSHPRHLTKHKFHQMIKDVHERMDWSFGTIDIRDYKSTPFLRYMCKGDFEKIILSACSRG